MPLHRARGRQTHALDFHAAAYVDLKTGRTRNRDAGTARRLIVPRALAAVEAAVLIALADAMAFLEGE